MSVTIAIGTAPGGAEVHIDIQELLASRLLVQGNSGSGKSHLLRRLLEKSAGFVQQVVIDPEGDFVTLADAFGHIVIDASAHAGAEISKLAARVREHRISVVLDLNGLELESQMRCAAQFLSALFEAPRNNWYPALVVVDEAQVFAPSAAGEVSDEARRVSLAAMTNLMCRGRKRGLAGVIATQRLAKLAKNVAAEASNFLMGRTFLDIDMARAADLLGMERRQAEQIRDLDRGHFLGLGPAISRRPVAVKIGSVQTGSNASSHALTALPGAAPEEMHALLHGDSMENDRQPPAPMRDPEPVDADTLSNQVARHRNDACEQPPSHHADASAADDLDGQLNDIFAQMAAEEGMSLQPAAALYQNFSVRCRMRRLSPGQVDLATFRRRFAMALAGISDPNDEKRQDLLRLAERVSDDLLAPFLLLATAAQDDAPCPDEESLARVYGTTSQGRIRRLIDHLEKIGLIVVRTDFSGRKSIGIPELGIVTRAC